jgi:DNA polymerase-1
VLYKYNAYDVTSTYSLYVLFVERLERQGLRELHDFLVAASNELMFVELNGIAVDRTYIGELTKEAESVLEGIRQRIDDILTEVAFTQKDARGRTKPFNPNSPVQVKLVLNKLKAYVSSTDADHLQAILDQCKKMNRQNGPLYRFVDELMHHRKEAKLYGTYIKGTSKRLYRGRVYPTFLLHGTTTGRLSCRNPNLQNVPRGSRIKNLFVPAKPGNVFVQADYAQAELRVLAWLAQESYFRDILNDPTRDLFDELTPRLYPKLPSKAEVNSTKAGQEHWKDIRVRVKAFVYGLSYGRTPEGLAMEYGMSVMEARNMYALFFSTIPNVVEYQKNLLAQVKRGEDLVTPFGRHRRFWLITVNNWDDIQNQALAFLPQSTSSDVCLRAMVAIRRELRGTGAFIRNIVHDSILVDCPPDMARDIGIVLDRHMVASGEELVSGYVDFKTDVKIGNRWGEV